MNTGAGEPLVTLGEIQTCLLPTAVPVTRAEAVQLLALVPGRAVRWRERPLSLGISPRTAVGVDCDLPLLDRSVRVIGTVATNLTLTGGRILQSSAVVRVVAATEAGRRPWSYYLDHKGTIEIADGFPSRLAARAELERGYLRTAPDDRHLDLASISEGLLDRARNSPELDHDPPLRAETTRLRWTALADGGFGPDLTMEHGTVRTARLAVRSDADLAAAKRFCEDLAVHDWLLTTFSSLLTEADRYGLGSDRRLDLWGSALEHLTGLWMPAVHTPPSMRVLWRRLQRDPGFSRQWNLQVARARDGIAVATLNALRQRHIR